MYPNLYALPAIIACIISAYVGIYVFSRNPKNIQNRTFILYILFIIAFCIGEAMARLSSNIGEALLWGRITYLGIIFAPILFLHLSFVFPREKIMTRPIKYELFGFYLIGIVTLCLFNLVSSAQDVQNSMWGYRLPLNTHTYFIGMLVTATLVFAIFNLTRSYQISGSLVERRQVEYLFYDLQHHPDRLS